ncbi:hypothetical protein Lalb_Chr17g0342091 [Lupinus albus]|uniref:Uncharacterized protein n=1 Tax=Lupinus albus TaxID=3870 RepID=A0A6A4P2G8_LUPAL|nr:hypothetical protein Lalb_Chr17g0342091 [Lupinus albus]
MIVSHPESNRTFVLHFASKPMHVYLFRCACRPCNSPNAFMSYTLLMSLCYYGYASNNISFSIMP